MDNQQMLTVKRTLSGWVASGIEILFFLPLIMVLYVYLVPDYYARTAVWLLPLISLAGVLGEAAGVKVFWKQLITALLLGGGYAALLLVLTPEGLPVFHAAAGFLFALQALTARGRRIRLKLYWVGIGIYFVGGIAYPRLAAMSDLLPVITVCGVLCLTIVLSMTNRRYLGFHSLSGQDARTLPKDIRRYNTFLVGCIVIAAVLLAGGAGRWAGQMILSVIRGIVQWLFRPSKEPLPEPQLSEPPGAPGGIVLPEDSGSPSWLAQLLDIAFYVLAGGVLLALAALIVYMIYKYAGTVLSRWLGKLLDFLLQRRADEEQQGYQDEEVKLNVRSKTEGPGGTWAERWAARLFGKRETWEKLRNNRERVRYLYRRQLQEDEAVGLKRQPALTPRELELKVQEKTQSSEAKGKKQMDRGARDSLLALYYRVRYGEQEPEDDEVTTIKEHMQL